MSAAPSYDAIVIGSGITGGWAAKELTEKGLRTLVLEAGRPIDPGEDFVEHVPTWEMRYHGQRDRRRQLIDQPVQRQCYACDEMASKFFVNDLEHPYTTDPDKPFIWIRGRQVGGKSIMWARQTYRWSDLDFEANVREGVGVDWPIRYKDIAPWYDYVEDFVGVSGNPEGLSQLPDGKFLPPMEMNCVEQHVREQLAGHFGGERMLTIGRCAVLTRDHRGRAACHYCGPCHRGCVQFSYFSSIGSTLPAARATGRLTLRPHSVVRRLVFDPATRRISGVDVIDAVTREYLEFRGLIIFLCASTLESTRILLNSATPEFPDGLANSSGELGHNLMDHHFEVGADGEFDGFLDRHPIGNRPNGVYVPRFRNVKAAHPDFVRGYGMQGGAWRDGWDRGNDLPGYGADFKQRIITPGPWRMSLEAFGECLPRHDNYVDLDPEKTDAWGVPALRIRCTWGDNERAMKKDMPVTAGEMLEAAGARNVKLNTNGAAPGLCIHEMGTARMGKDPKTSVLNGWNQAHDAKNLFVPDGASMASSGCQNPSITYMALTARACDHAVREMRRHNL
jgi:choline dehydrogenase-like flavoprotein